MIKSDVWSGVCRHDAHSYPIHKKKFLRREYEIIEKQMEGKKVDEEDEDPELKALMDRYRRREQARSNQVTTQLFRAASKAANVRQHHSEESKA